MVKKIFIAFITISLLILIFGAGIYAFRVLTGEENTAPDSGTAGVENKDENKNDIKSDEKEDDGKEEEEYFYKEDVALVHLCDGYSDGSFSIRNIKLGMTFRQVVDTELKNVGVYVGKDGYSKNTFDVMQSDDGEGADMLPVKERALLGNACEILYNFDADISVEEPEKYPYLQSVQYTFLKKEGVDLQKKIMDAFSDCFGKPETAMEGEYYVAVFEGEKETVSMYYAYDEDKTEYSLRYIIWQ